jgi:glycosyltransferase involved in cell wall biosynthesis
VGRCIFENTQLGDVRSKTAEFDALLCGSRWNGEILASHTDKPVTVIHEGIDPALFHPGPRSGVLNPGRFYIFSGGKVEFRKAQDVVLRAFQIFSRIHPDAVLVTAWQSPWPHLARGYQGILTGALELRADGMLDVHRWAHDNGIDSEKVLDIGLIPNAMMPAVLREMDCAVQVSRAEACTNLPAKEAMACGVPTIVAANTGVLDLLAQDNCIALVRQRPVNVGSDYGTQGWGESDLEELLLALETLYSDTATRRRIGEGGARWIPEQSRTWATHATALKTYCQQL